MNIIIELTPLKQWMEKKECQKYSCLILNKGTLLWFMVTRVYKTLGIKLKRSRACSYQWIQNVHFLVDLLYISNKDPKDHYLTNSACGDVMCGRK